MISHQLKNMDTSLQMAVKWLLQGDTCRVTWPVAIPLFFPLCHV